MFELWDLETANAIGEYQTLEDALMNVRMTARLYGRPAVITWGLLFESENGETTRIAIREDLSRLAGVPERVVSRRGPMHKSDTRNPASALLNARVSMNPAHVKDPLTLRLVT